MLPLLPTPCVFTILGLPKPLAKPSRADSDERWRKTKAASIESSASSSPRSADSVRSNAGRGSSCKNATSPPPKPGRADSVERWDAHKKAASPASSSSGTSPLVSSTCTISHASSAERWDVHKKRRPRQAKALDDAESSSTGSNDIDTEEEEEEEEILWKPRAMYAGPGFVVAAPESSMLPMPTAFLVSVA
jgi:hypothetical protein